MSNPSTSMYYISAAVAIGGTVGYHSLIKRIPSTIDPMVSIIGIYIGVILVGMVLFPFVSSKGQVLASVKQLGWIQLGIAVCITMMEWGFILMYRNGWDLSVGNVVTGVAINLALMGIGVLLLHENLNKVNIAGIFLCIAGVAMIGYRGNAEGSATKETAAVDGATLRESSVAE